MGDDNRETLRTEPSNPFSEASQAKKAITLAAILCAVFGSILQSATLSTMLPIAAADVGGESYYSLASTIGAPLSIAAMPLWGYIAARSPHLKVPLLMASMACGVLAVALRLIAPNMFVIIGAMFFWGFVSPGVYVIGYALIRDMYDSQKAGFYLGVCSTVIMAAMIVGPIGGGALMTALGWRSLNVLVLPFMIAALVLPAFGVRASKRDCAHLAHAGGKFDVAGTIALCIGLGGLILYLSAGTSLIPFFSMASNILLVVTVVALIIMVRVIVKKQADAIVPAPAMKNRNVLAFTSANFCANFSNMAAFFFMPTFIIYVLGGTSTDSGLVMACFSVFGVFLGPVFGKMIGKQGTAKGVLVLSASLRVVVSIAMIFVLTSNPSIPMLMVTMLIAGLYNSSHGVCFSAGPQVQLPEDLRVQGNSVIQCGQNFGSGVGTAIYTVIIGVFGVTGGMPVALGVAAVFGALTLVSALFLKKLDA